MEVMRKNYEKRINEKWRKALKHLGINENLYPTRKADLIAQYSPFTDASIEKIKDGVFAERQIDRIVFEITNFEVVNGCFHSRFKDLEGNEI
jgi:hypothetical protein